MNTESNKNQAASSTRTIVTPRLPSGFQELLPAEQLEFQRLLDIIRSSYESYGFTPIDTPDIELSEILLAEGGGETEKQVYRFTRDNSSTDLTLRYDLTVPLARYAAMHESTLQFPFRRYHIGKVHRAERAQKGRFREFYQCDIDIIGSQAIGVDAEFPVIINSIFEKFAFGEFVIHINNRRILTGFLQSIEAQESTEQIIRLFDKFHKISADIFSQELHAIGLNETQLQRINNFVAIAGDTSSVIARLQSLDVLNEEFQQGLTDLTTVIELLAAYGMPAHRYKIDITLARGLDYYTGTVFETFLTDYPQLGSVCSGGRYDDLASQYTKTRLPGVGISIGITRLFAQLKEIPGVLQYTKKSPADAIVIPVTNDQITVAAQFAQKLRNQNQNIILYTEMVKFSKRMNYANALGCTYAYIIGEDEIASGHVQQKNMHTGDTTTVSLV